MTANLHILNVSMPFAERLVAIRVEIARLGGLS